MPKDPDVLEYRIISEEEVIKNPIPKVKALAVEKIVKRFIDPQTGKPIKLMQAVEIGPFDSENEGMTWLRYYMSDVYKHKDLCWGKEVTKAGHVKSPIAIDPRPRDGKFYFWVIRVTE